LETNLSAVTAGLPLPRGEGWGEGIKYLIRDLKTPHPTLRVDLSLMER
jgi:hypothetical protein